MLLSLCMIVKNEEQLLEGCLEAARPHVDEIVVVDTGSEDATRDIAARYADKLLHFDWVDDFSAARNFSIEQASSDWVLVLDADEVMAGPDLEQIRQCLADTDKDAFVLIQRDYTNNSLEPGWQAVTADERLNQDYAGYVPVPVIRLFRRAAGLYFEGRIHERVTVPEGEGTWDQLLTPIHHYADSDPTKPRIDRQRQYLESMERELESRPDGRLFFMVGQVYKHYEKNYGMALQRLNQALAEGYNPAQTQEALAETLYLKGDFDEARALYRQLFEEDHRSFAVCLNLANLEVKAGELAVGLECLKLAQAQCNVGTQIYRSIEHNIAYLQRQIGG